MIFYTTKKAAERLLTKQDIEIVLIVFLVVFVVVVWTLAKFDIRLTLYNEKNGWLGPYFFSFLIFPRDISDLLKDPKDK